MNRVVVFLILVKFLDNLNRSRVVFGLFVKNLATKLFGSYVFPELQSLLVFLSYMKLL